MDNAPIKAFYLDDGATEMHWASVVRLRDWEALPYVWRSPLWTLRRHHWNFGDERSRIWAITENDAKDIAVVAAEAAFWDFPLTRLKSVAAHEGVALEASTSLCDALVALISTFLKCGEERALEIMAIRLQSPSAHISATYTELLDCREALFFHVERRREGHPRRPAGRGQVRGQGRAIVCAMARQYAGCE